MRQGCAFAASDESRGHFLAFRPGRDRAVPSTHRKDRQELRDIRTDWSTRDEMNEFAVENFDAGWAAHSTLTSVFRSPTTTFTGTRPDPSHHLVVGGGVPVRAELPEPRPGRPTVRFQRPLRDHAAAMRAAQSRAFRSSSTSAEAASRSSRFREPPAPRSRLLPGRDP